MTSKSKLKIWLIALLTAVVVLIQPLQFTARNSAKAEDNTANADADSEMLLGSTVKDGYDQYIAPYKKLGRPEREILVEGESYTKAEAMSPSVVDGIEGADGKVVQTGDSGTISWEIDVQEEGLYNVAVKYQAMKGKGSDIDREFMIDGKLPFSEARHLVFHRLWNNEGPTVRDEDDNDMYTPQMEVVGWQETFIQSSDGRHVDPYLFYFSKGKHVISLVSAKEPMMIDYIKLTQTEQVPSYKELSEQYKQNGYKPAADVFIKIQGEASGLKSSRIIYPMMDRSSPATEPYDVSKIRLNTVGDANWSEAGQWVSWTIDAPEDGLYKIGVKFSQSIQRGMTSYRKLTIDGKLPFAEMNTTSFPFGTDWQMNVLGDGKDPYLFYLTKGKHELRMEVTLGDMALFLRTIESSVLDLNTIFRKIVMVTGTKPDEFRDYQLELKIPELLDVLKKEADVLESVVTKIEAMSGGASDRTATLTRLIIQMREMAENPETIARQLDSFKSNISSLGDWIFSINFMPMSIDYIVVASPDAEMPSPTASFWEKLKMQVGSFVLSFFYDYNALGSSKDSDKQVEVWITMGLEQAKIIKRMVEESFSSKTGVAVNIKVVTEGVLLQAMLAGRGPDVAFAVPNDKPLNYALRNAVEDLSKYPGFDEVKKQFHESAFVPYEFNGGVYALPQDQYFPVLFYRKDILDELKLKVPQTWDEVYAMIPELQKQNLIFGFPEQVLVKLGSNVQDSSSLPVNFLYGTLLYQENGEIYRDGGKSSALDSEASIKAFMEWSDLYTTYKLPLSTDFVGRFRSGEMPIGIADYTRFNVISVVAPELKGLWDFTLIPGRTTPDGSIRRDVPTAGNGVVMMKDSKNKQYAWEFMKWWTGTDAQAKYGVENEAIFGPGGRYATANLDAVAQIPWQSKDYKVLLDQWKWAKGIPEVPGGYFTGRHLDNAFRSVVISNEDPRESIDKYTRFVNDEIKKKRKEFGLPTE